MQHFKAASEVVWRFVCFYNTTLGQIESYVMPRWADFTVLHVRVHHCLLSLERALGSRVVAMSSGAGFVHKNEGTTTVNCTRVNDCIHAPPISVTHCRELYATSARLDACVCWLSRAYNRQKK